MVLGSGLNGWQSVLRVLGYSNRQFKHPYGQHLEQFTFSASKHIQLLESHTTHQPPTVPWPILKSLHFKPQSQSSLINVYIQYVLTIIQDTSDKNIPAIIIMRQPLARTEPLDRFCPSFEIWQPLPVISQSGVIALSVCLTTLLTRAHKSNQTVVVEGIPGNDAQEKAKKKC